MSFDVSADAYMRFMGKYSEPPAAQFADLAGVRAGQQVLDVGCGPGALTAELVSRVGADAVSAVEPSASFAAATRERLPGVEVRLSPAEQLPFPDGAFDAAMALGGGQPHLTSYGMRRSFASVRQGCTLPCGSDTGTAR